MARIANTRVPNADERLLGNHHRQDQSWSKQAEDQDRQRTQAERCQRDSIGSSAAPGEGPISPHQHQPAHAHQEHQPQKRPGAGEGEVAFTKGRQSVLEEKLEQ